MLRTTLSFLALTSAGLASQAVAKDVPTRPFLTLDAAQSGAAACLAYASEQGLRVAVSIKDRAGRDVLSMRMDDVFQKQIEFASIKAETASTTPLSTKRLGEIAVTGSPVAGLVYVPGLTGVEGGEPVRTEAGYHMGGVGVSGATPAQDGACARKAVDAILAAG